MEQKQTMAQYILLDFYEGVTNIVLLYVVFICEKMR